MATCNVNGWAMATGMGDRVRQRRCVMLTGARRRQAILMGDGTTCNVEGWAMETYDVDGDGDGFVVI